jgi:HAE1 family hydrophobic/amphiphilic exporter-1
VAVFLPIALLTGIAGSFFRPFALTVVVALLASLVVAVTVVPLLAAHLLPALARKGAERRLPYNWMQRVYVPTVRWATGHRLIALGIAAVMFFGSMALIPLLRVNLLDQSSSPDFRPSMPENLTPRKQTRRPARWKTLIRGAPGTATRRRSAGNPFAPPARCRRPDPRPILVLVQRSVRHRAGRWREACAARE